MLNPLIIASVVILLLAGQLACIALPNWYRSEDKEPDLGVDIVSSMGLWKACVKTTSLDPKKPVDADLSMCMTIGESIPDGAKPDTKPTADPDFPKATCNMARALAIISSVCLLLALGLLLYEQAKPYAGMPKWIFIFLIFLGGMLSLGSVLLFQKIKDYAEKPSTGSTDKPNKFSYSYCSIGMIVSGVLSILLAGAVAIL